MGKTCLFGSPRGRSPLLVVFSLSRSSGAFFVGKTRSGKNLRVVGRSHLFWCVFALLSLYSLPFYGRSPRLPLVVVGKNLLVRKTHGWLNWRFKVGLYFGKTHSLVGKTFQEKPILRLGKPVLCGWPLLHF